jgi:hypothetical protein
VAYRPHYPRTNGDMILNLLPADGFASSPLWNSKLLKNLELVQSILMHGAYLFRFSPSDFTLAQLNAGRVAAGLPPAVLDTDFENGNGTLVINGGDMLYVIKFADGTSSAGFGSWVSDLPPDAPPSEDLYYVGDVNNVTSTPAPGSAAWINPKDYWGLLVNDNEDGTWGATLFSVVNTTGLTTTAVKLIGMKNGVPALLIDLTSKFNLQTALSGPGSDNPNGKIRVFSRSIQFCSFVSFRFPLSITS